MDDLIERIYEAAFVPEEWPRILCELALLSGSKGATIFLFNDGKSDRGISLDNLRPLMAEFLENKTLRFSTGVTRMCSIQPASFVEVDNFMTASEIANDPIRIRLRALGFGAHLCTAIPMPSGELVIFAFTRTLDAGPYERDLIGRLDLLRPHLARSGLIAARLGLERAQSTVAAMEILGLPAAVLASPDARVIATNALLDDLPTVFRPAAFGRLTVSHPGADALLQAAMKDGAQSSDAAVRSIPLHGRDGEPGMVIHVLPLRRAAQDIFSGGDLLIAVTSVSASSVVPSPTILSGLFDLAPAEAKLASTLAAGKSLKQAAADSGIQVSTARSYLEQIFRKTGTHQQSELVALLKSTQPLRRPI